VEYLREWAEQLEALAADRIELPAAAHHQVGLLDGALGVLAQGLGDTDDGDAGRHGPTGDGDRSPPPGAWLPGRTPVTVGYRAGLTPASRLRQQTDSIPRSRARVGATSRAWARLAYPPGRRCCRCCRRCRWHRRCRSYRRSGAPGPLGLLASGVAAVTSARER